MEEEKMMKIDKLKVQAHKLEVVWAEDVVREIVALASRKGWVLDEEEVKDCVYQDPPWTWGDAEYTLIDAKVFVRVVMDRIPSCQWAEAEVKGQDFSFDYDFDLVALIG